MHLQESRLKEGEEMLRHSERERSENTKVGAGGGQEVLQAWNRSSLQLTERSLLQSRQMWPKEAAAHGKALQELAPGLSAARGGKSMLEQIIGQELQPKGPHTGAIHPCGKPVQDRFGKDGIP